MLQYCGRFKIKKKIGWFECNNNKSFSLKETNLKLD